MKAFSDPQSPVRRMTRAATEVVFGRAKSIRATVMQLTTCTLGAGILTLPFALSCFGLGLGLIVLVCNSAFALVCSYFLSMACALQPLCAARSDVRRARRPAPNHHIARPPRSRAPRARPVSSPLHSRDERSLPPFHTQARSRASTATVVWRAPRAARRWRSSSTSLF